MIIYRAAAACGLVLEMAEHCGIHLPAVPLGGGALAQLGVVFGMAFVLTEGQESLARFQRWVAKPLRGLWQSLRGLWQSLRALWRGGRP